MHFFLEKVASFEDSVNKNENSAPFQGETLDLRSGKVTTMLFSMTSDDSKLPIGVGVQDVQRQLDITSKVIESVQNLAGDVRSHLSLIRDNMISQQSAAQNDMEFALQISSSVDNLCTRLEKVIAITGTHSTIHCGYVRKSSDFSRSDRSVSQSKLWCIVTPAYMLFMKEPYSAKIELEINFHAMGVEVYDPDEGEETLGKVSLTSKLWFRNSQNGAILVVDYDTFDEKVIWIEALKPWLSVATAQTMKQMKAKSRLSIALNLNSSSSQITGSSQSANSTPTHAILVVQSNSSSNLFLATEKASTESVASSSSNVSGSTRVNRFQSAATNMMKALQFKKKSKQNAAQETEAPLRQIFETIDAENHSHCDGDTEFPEQSQKPHFYPNFLDSNMYIHAFPHAVKRKMKDAIELKEVAHKSCEAFRNSIAKMDINKDTDREAYNRCYSMFSTLLLSLLGMDNCLNELSDSAMKYNQENMKKIHSLTKELQVSISECDRLTRESSRHLKQKAECDSLLESLTVQNINTTLEMSKKYDDLMEYYNELRYQDNSSAAHNSLNSQESVKSLTTSLREVEKMLQHALETENMFREEVLSSKMELEFIQEACEAKRRRLEKAKEVAEVNTAFRAQKLAELRARRERAQRERDEAKAEYEALLRKLAQDAHVEA